MNEVFDPKRSEIAAYSPFRAQLAELKENNATLIFDYEDPKGNKDARSHVYKLRQTKASVDRVRKEEKAASLEYGRRVDSEAKEIVDQLEGMIEVHQAPLREIEEREEKRLEMIKSSIAEIQEGGQQSIEQWMNLPLEAMEDRLKEIEAEPTDEETWGEFRSIAVAAIDKAKAQIGEAIAKRKQHDQDQEELQQLRELKEEQERERQERERKEREERIAKDAEERAKQEAEQAAQAERERVEREAREAKEAAERRERELQEQAERAEKEAKEAAERAERAERDATEKAKREAEEKARKEREESEKREANKRHRAKINREAMDAFVVGGLSESDAKSAVELIAKREVPHVSISY